MRKPLILALLALSPFAMAAPTAFFNGFIVSGAFGGTTAQFNYSQELIAEGSVLAEIKSESNLFANSPAGLVSLAYSYQMVNNFVVAGAFTAGYAYAKLTEQTNDLFAPGTLFEQNASTQLNAQLTNDFSLVFKPGYVWDRTTLFYTLLGPRWGNFKTSSKLDLELPGITQTASRTKSGYEWGVTMGLGIQQLINPRYSWGLEYAYTTYGRISSPSISGSLPSIPLSYSSKPTLDASSNTIMFLIAYRI